MCIVRFSGLGHNGFAAARGSPSLSRGYQISWPPVYSKCLTKHGQGGASIIESHGVAMTNRRFIAGILFLVYLAASSQAVAHHSSSSYDMYHPVNLKGVVSNIEWTNPQVFIFLDVKGDNGGVEEWRVEGNSPNMLTRVGWKKEMIKAGDQLVVNGALAKNGAKIMRRISLTLADGQKLDGQGFK